jgi:hypothetical protein
MRPYNIWVAIYEDDREEFEEGELTVARLMN